MFRSIRWRLPLSYAAIALLAASSLGVVLLITLRGYYVRRERTYLTGNAQAIQGMMALLVEAGTSPAALSSQLKSFAFLSRTRVRLLDENEQVLADSGTSRETQQVDVVALTIAGNPLQVTQRVTRTVGAPGNEAGYGSFIVIKDASTDVTVTENVVITTTGSTPGSDLVLPVPRPYLPDEQGIEESGYILSMNTVGTPYGLGFDVDAASDVRRSKQVVRQPFYDREGSLLGYVELLEGPAYGRQVLESVAWGWGIASGVAVSLAAGVGWFISLHISAPLLTLTDVTARMSGGDLAARADVRRTDEFGTLARSFNQMAERVEDTVATLRRFVSDAAHEIHTPLTALRTNLELAPQESFVRRAQAQVAQLEALTEGLLDLSHIESGSDREVHTSVDLVRLVRQVSEMYASRAEQAEQTFDLTLPEYPTSVLGDEAQLRRALGNLLDNALKFTPQGGSVRVGLGREGDWTILWVEDTGIGIPEEDLPHLWDRFHRGRNAAAYPGSGLGLAIVKAILRGHGGDVKAENTSRGAQFTLQLPVG